MLQIVSALMLLPCCMQATPSGTGIVVARNKSQSHSPIPANHLLTLQLQPSPEETPLIANLLPSDLPHIEDLPLQGMDITPGALAFEISHSRIAEVFDMLQDDIKLWSTSMTDDACAISPADLPPEVLQQHQDDREAKEREQSAEGSGTQSAALQQGSAETSGSGDAGKQIHCG